MKHCLDGGTWSQTRSSVCMAGQILLAAVLITLSATAQIKSSTITGLVTDATGAVIPGATVTVVNEETNITTGVTTDTTGGFTVPYLAPGTYRVQVEKNNAGFSKAVRTGIQVSTAQTVRIEIALQAGGATETVTVTADAATLQTTNATVGGAVNERVIQTLPNINHNPFNYVALQAGVTPRGAFNNTQSTTSFGIGIDGRRQASAIGINGGSAFSNDIQLDGVSVQGSAWNEVAVLPNQDALQEVRTITNNYSAESSSLRPRAAATTITAPPSGESATKRSTPTPSPTTPRTSGAAPSSPTPTAAPLAGGSSATVPSSSPATRGSNSTATMTTSKLYRRPGSGLATSVRPMSMSAAERSQSSSSTPSARPGSERPPNIIGPRLRRRPRLTGWFAPPRCRPTGSTPLV